MFFKSVPNKCLFPKTKNISILSHGLLGGLALSLFIQVNTWAAFTYPGCSEVTDADFRIDTLAINKKDASVQEPLKMAFDMDAQGNVDVYFVQRLGLLRRYKASTKSLENIGDFSVLVSEFAKAKDDNESDGLTGIALDPNFKTNHWIYLHFGLGHEWKVFRYTLKGNTLDLSTEKLLLNIPTSGTTKHTAGALTFDKAGNLFIATANNYAEESPLNTNDWRGKILRIKPKPLVDNVAVNGIGPGITYDIPDGNLFPQSVTANIGKTKPEIYIMGARNPYTLTVDPLNNAITWGDIGPDAVGPLTEESNYAMSAGNYGYPYFAGNNINRTTGGNADTLNQTNNFTKNTGLKNLPPVRSATYFYVRAAAITGPVYRYNEKLNSPNKMPPHFDGMWFLTDYERRWIKAANLDASGKIVGTPQDVFKNFKATGNGPLDFQEGPDGQFYIVEHVGGSSRTSNSETGIYKISYKGNACITSGIYKNQYLSFSQSGISLGNNSVTFSELGKHRFVLKNLMGQDILRREGQGPYRYSLSEMKKPGIYILEAITEKGSFTAKLMKN